MQSVHGWKMILFYLGKSVPLLSIGEYPLSIFQPKYIRFQMNKAEVIAKISTQTGIHRSDVQVVVETLFQVVQQTLIDGQEAHFKGFGSASIGRILHQAKSNMLMVIDAIFRVRVMCILWLFCKRAICGYVSLAITISFDASMSIEQPNTNSSLGGSASNDKGYSELQKDPTKAMQACFLCSHDCAYYMLRESSQVFLQMIERLALELVISAVQDGFRIAFLRDGELIEYQTEEKDTKFTVGDIYLGTVKKIAHNLNATFVDVGYKKDAFLHYSDLGPQFHSISRFTQLALNGELKDQKLNDFALESPIDKLGKISDVIHKNQSILVQVAKEPISSKGPRLSAELALAGRYMILVPFNQTVNVSKRITSNEERQRLLRLVSSIKPANFGIIIRTAAEGKEVAKLVQDLKDLVEKWENGAKTLQHAAPRDKIIGEVNRASSILRDMLSEKFDSIVIDDATAYSELKQYIKTIAPEKEKIVKQYQGKAKLFEHLGIEKQLKLLFGQTVSIAGGGYLIIEHTEAMHVIDVNSGNSTVESDHEEMALNINLAAAKEIARQLRLRDMGGIIVIDFIDIRSPENRRKIYQAMKEYLSVDRSKVTVLPLSKFGLMQITRQRVRPVTNLITQEQCPACEGTGKISPAILVADQVEKSIHLLLTTQNEESITLFVHPYLYAYFTVGLFSRRLKWLLKYKRWINLAEDSSLGITEYKFINKQGEEIELS
eukprot:gene136-185_t